MNSLRLERIKLATAFLQEWLVVAKRRSKLVGPSLELGGGKRWQARGPARKVRVRGSAG